MSKPRINKSLYTVDGINSAQAKRMIKFMFPGAFINIEKNDEECVFDILIKDSVDKKAVEKLMKEYPSFNIQYATIKPARA